ncbi:prostatic acid phosphatase-like isoform X1 [Parasteatoda tepidariorum]|uniref:prostatic acid phosphatase-like isoform X1 n=1 Tax=Parasteatoda tepidariorum TaxID=114398 RepID=UPI00077FB45E|nr:prostatic acid phosphatase-like isoform X2 [Parasteatoda tepidariorum]
MRILNKDLFFIFIVLIFVFSLKNILESFFIVSPSLLQPLFLEPFVLEEERGKRKLVLLQMIFRHGHRAPYQTFPSNPYNIFVWEEGYESLTKLGRLQNYVMGRHLQEMYYDFITTNPKEIQVFTSEAARSFYGSYAFVTGLYAPKKEYQFTEEILWQPITSITSESVTILGRGDCLRAELEEYAFAKTKLFNETNERFRLFFRYLSFHVGAKVDTCLVAARVAKTLNSQEAYNLTSPKWALLYWEELQHQIVLNYYFRYATKTLIRLRVGNLLKHMINSMQKRINNENIDTRVIAYSGHGSTINQVLFSLNQYNNLETPMAATFIAELWKERKNKYSVRWLLFNSSNPEKHINPPIALYFEDCGGEFCPLENLINRTKDFIPTNWDDECDFKVHIPLEKLDPVADLPPFQPLSTSLVV